MHVRLRQMVERQIVEAVIDAALAKKLKLTVHDGDEIVVEEETNKAKVMDKMFDTDEAMLSFSDPKNAPKTAQLGCVQFVFGNTGTDVISDHVLPDDLSDIVKEADQIADYWESEGPWVTFEQWRKERAK